MEKKPEVKAVGGLKGGPEETTIKMNDSEKWVRPERTKAAKYKKGGEKLAQKIGRLANLKK